MTFALAVIRALHFASLMTAFGASALIAQARRAGVAVDGMRRVLRIAAVVALLSAFAGLCGVAAEMTGDGAAAFDPAALGAVAAHTSFGHVFLIRVALLAGLVALAFVTQAQALRAAVAGVALALLGLTSHAAAAGAPQYALARAGIDALHLITAGFWVGGLVVLVREVWARPADHGRLLFLLRAFSRWGAASVAVLVLAGTLNAVAILDVPGMHWSTGYLTWLAVKIALAAVMVTLALTNRFAVLPALARGEADARETIPLTVTAELGFALLILVIVGFLGILAPMDM